MISVKYTKWHLIQFPTRNHTCSGIMSKVQTIIKKANKLNLLVSFYKTDGAPERIRTSGTRIRNPE